MEEKRRGYPTMEAQVEANKRYLSQEEKRKNKYRNDRKSFCKKFLREDATLEEITEIEKIIEERKRTLKQKEDN